MNMDRRYLYRTIKEYLVKEIKLLNPNDRLPSRTALVKKYDVTRSTIERAISELIGEGILYSVDGSGTYVAEEANTSKSTDHLNDIVNWGVIMPDIRHDAYPEILRGIEDVARGNGINIFVGSSDNSESKQSEYIENQVRSGIKGIIIVPAVVFELDLLPFINLQEKGIPIVFCNRGMPGIRAPRVLSNNFYGGYIATKHLVQVGYKRIAYVSRPWYSSSLERYQGYLSALHEAGITLEKNYIKFDKSWDSTLPGYDSTKLIMENDLQPDAIFCFNDEIAEGCYKALTDLDYKIGEDIGLIGYNDSPVCERFPVKLSSVKFRKYETGKRAARLLLKIINNEFVHQEETEILMPELVIRESCPPKNGALENEGNDAD